MQNLWSSSIMTDCDEYQIISFPDDILNKTVFINNHIIICDLLLYKLL